MPLKKLHHFDKDQTIFLLYKYYFLTGFCSDAQRTGMLFSQRSQCTVDRKKPLPHFIKLCWCVREAKGVNDAICVKHSPFCEEERERERERKRERETSTNVVFMQT